MTASVIATIAVIAILIFFIVWGYTKGLLRMVLSTALLLVTIALAGVIAPHASVLIRDSFIGEGIEKGIGSYIDKNVDTAIINNVQTAQEMFIDKLPLPSFIKSDISENNTPAEYVSRKVTDFSGYIKDRLTLIAVNIITYAILLVLVYIVLRILMHLFRIINKIPIIGGINRLFGAILGLLEGLLIVWALCLLVMLLANTPIGVKALEVIRGSAFLNFLYEKNGIVIGAAALFKALM